MRESEAPMTPASRTTSPSASVVTWTTGVSARIAVVVVMVSLRLPCPPARGIRGVPDLDRRMETRLRGPCGPLAVRHARADVGPSGAVTLGDLLRYGRGRDAPARDDSLGVHPRRQPWHQSGDGA